MPTTDPEYYRRRYAEDAEYRASVIQSTKRYQAKMRAEDASGYAAKRKDAGERHKARYREDAEYRERYLAAQRERQRAKKRQSTPLEPVEDPGGGSAASPSPPPPRVL